MPRRVLEGEVVSDKMDKTVTVLVQRRYMHPVYKKYVMKTDKYAAHDENNHFKAGERVSIIECAPISKRKRWTVLVNGQEVAREATGAPALKKEAAKVKKEASSNAASPKKAAAKKKDA